MREHPWHDRCVTTQSELRFAQLTEIHRLTLGWLHEAQPVKTPEALPRGLTTDATENLWMLESVIAGESLEQILDDTYPEDLLSRFEHTVWAVQAATLAAMMRKTPESEQAALRSILEQASWKRGRSWGLEKWAGLQDDVREDCKALQLTLADTAFPGSSTAGYLVRRATSSELAFEVRGCPHHSPYAEVKAVADELCPLQMNWIRGFAYALNSRIRAENSRSGSRCTQEWFLHG